MEEVEWCFFKYAFPCSQTLLQQGRITSEEYNDMKINFENRKAPSKKMLENLFPAAFLRIKRLAKRMEKNYWDSKVIKEYWKDGHNEIIEEGEGIYGISPRSFKDLCKIQTAEVIEKKEKFLVVLYDSQGKKEKRIVFNDLTPNVNIGDKVRLHYAYAIEIIK